MGNKFPSECLCIEAILSGVFLQASLSYNQNLTRFVKKYWERGGFHSHFRDEKGKMPNLERRNLYYELNSLKNVKMELMSIGG